MPRPTRPDTDADTVKLPASERAPKVGPSRPRGSAVGRYVVLDALGTGGMATVYSAYDPQLDRRVALKFLRAVQGEEETEEWRGRLLREAQAMARLSHPNVLTVYDVGVAEDGQVFLSMEIVDGGTLSDWLKEGKRTWRPIVKLLCQAGDGLAAAHEVGIVHRDFKPDNVLLAFDGRPRVTDFGVASVASWEGIASVASAAPGRASTMSGVRASIPPASLSASGITPAGALPPNPTTMEGVLLGTPGYMAPEQYGCTDAIDARADIFAFCATLYRALYGERPFAGSTVVEIAQATLNGQMRAAPKGSDVPAWLRRVIVSGLAAEPSARPASMRELLAALRADPARRHRRWAAVGTLALAGCTAASVVHASGQRHVRECRATAERLGGVWDAPRKASIERAFQATHLGYAADTWNRVGRAFDAYAAGWSSAMEQACVAARVRGERSETMLQLQSACLDDRLDELRALGDVLSTADRKTVETAVQATQALSPLDACTDLDRLSAAARLPTDPVARAEIRSLQSTIATAKALSEARRSLQSLERLRSARDRVERTAFGPLIVAWTLGMANAEVEIDSNAAMADFERVTMLADANRLDLPKAEAFIKLSDRGMNVADYEQSHRWIGLANAAIARTGGDPRLEVMSDAYDGWIDCYEGKTARAVPIFQRAIARANEKHIHDVGLLNAYLGLSHALVGQARFDEAFETYGAAIAFAEAELGPLHPGVGPFYNNLASDQVDAGRIDDALATASHAVALFQSAVVRGDIASNSQRLAGAEATLGQALLRAGRTQEAIDRLRLAHDAFDARSGAFIAITDNELGEAYRASGRAGEAAGALDEATSIEASLKDPAAAIVAATLTVRAKVAMDSGQAAEALPLVERALSLLEHGESALGALADTRLVAARARRELGRTDERTRTLAAQARDGFATIRDQGHVEQAQALLATLP